MLDAWGMLDLFFSAELEWEKTLLITQIICSQIIHTMTGKWKKKKKNQEENEKVSKQQFQRLLLFFPPAWVRMKTSNLDTTVGYVWKNLFQLNSMEELQPNLV